MSSEDHDLIKSALSSVVIIPKDTTGICESCTTTENVKLCDHPLDEQSVYMCKSCHDTASSYAGKEVSI